MYNFCSGMAILHRVQGFASLRLTLLLPYAKGYPYPLPKAPFSIAFSSFVCPCKDDQAAAAPCSKWKPHDCNSPMALKWDASRLQPTKVKSVAGCHEQLCLSLPHPPVKERQKAAAPCCRSVSRLPLAELLTAAGAQPAETEQPDTSPRYPHARHRWECLVAAAQ